MLQMEQTYNMHSRVNNFKSYILVVNRNEIIL